MFLAKTLLVICYNIYGHWSAFSADNHITQMKEHGDSGSVKSNSEHPAQGYFDM